MSSGVRRWVIGSMVREFRVFILPIKYSAAFFYDACGTMPRSSEFLDANDEFEIYDIAIVHGVTGDDGKG